MRGGESLREVDGEIDLAVVAVPAAAVPQVAADAAAKGVPAMVVLSGGFAEIGRRRRGAAAGARRRGPRRAGAGHRAELLRRAELRPAAERLDGRRAPRGAAGSRWSASPGRTGWRSTPWPSTSDPVRQGLRAGQHLRRDDRGAGRRARRATRRPGRCACSLESLGDGRAFVGRRGGSRPSKPVIVAKTGRSEAGARAAASHTAALAGQRGRVARGVPPGRRSSRWLRARSCWTPRAPSTASRCRPGRGSGS